MNLTRRKTLKRLTRYLSAACLAFTATAQAATVDLLVLYDQYSSDYFSGDPQTAMANWVNQMNAAYSDSQIDLQLRLVGVRHNEEVGADMGEVLNNLRQNNAVQSLRNQLGADFVSQMHSTAPVVWAMWPWIPTGPGTWCTPAAGPWSWPTNWDTTWG
ncbi:hypothetical protein [Microbulbifer halophilus]|uniref:hypothetical protein n=1 Tax=Microbulbifer halophilus TaxID=453963 RepID=UPI00361C0018